MMVVLAQIAMVAYGILLVVGGVMGRVKGNSTVSLVAGCTMGTCAWVGFWESLHDPMLGFLIGAMVALMLAGIFISRFARSKKFMPTGFLLLVSMIVGLLCMAARKEAEKSLDMPQALVNEREGKTIPRVFGPSFGRSSA
ncbi:MAG: TMEM14 family protein [bacterium]|nr:TMEM14 family protein [bacterium]